MPLPEGLRLRFDHVSIAVESIDRAYEFFARYFPIRLRSEKQLSEQAAGSFYWKDFYIGGFVVELIEDPPDREGFVTRFIKRHGEGFHHLSIETNHLAPIVDNLKRDGIRVVDEYDFGDGAATAFVSPRSAFGTLIQFWQTPDFGKHELPPRDARAHFDHVSLAVRSIDIAYKFFGRYLGARPMHEPHPAGGRFMLGHMEIAGFKVEFIQSPGKGSNNDFVARFIEKHGEGMHHVSIDVKDFDAMVAKLKADGIRIVDESVNWRGERQFFISPRSAFGTLIQVWDMS